MEGSPGPPGQALRTMRRVAAGSALLALACAVGLVVTSDGGFNALLAKGAAAVAQLGKETAEAASPGKTQELHWGAKFMKKYGITRTCMLAAAAAPPPPFFCFFFSSSAILLCIPTPPAKGGTELR
jgi:hypothetical protein